MRIQGKFLCILLVAVIGCGCAKEPLTKEKAKELIEATSDFQPRQVSVTLTPEEVRKGTEAGYWSLVSANKTNSQLPNMQVLILSPTGASYFRGAPAMFNPVLSINQKLGARVIEIKEIVDTPGNEKEKTVTYIWSNNFEYALPEVAELFKDQGPREGKKAFVYGKTGWEVKQ